MTDRSSEGGWKGRMMGWERTEGEWGGVKGVGGWGVGDLGILTTAAPYPPFCFCVVVFPGTPGTFPYTIFRPPEPFLDSVVRLLLEKKQHVINMTSPSELISAVHNKSYLHVMFI